jgi:hypothetical protein
MITESYRWMTEQPKAFAFFVVSGFSFSTFTFILAAVPQNYCQLFNGEAPAFSRSFLKDFLDWPILQRKRRVFGARFHRQCPWSNRGSGYFSGGRT